jgi:hypothetical protein
MTQNRGAAANDDIAIDVTKPKLEQLRRNDRDALDIKTWCMNKHKAAMNSSSVGCLSGQV